MKLIKGEKQDDPAREDGLFGICATDYGSWQGPTYSQPPITYERIYSCWMNAFGYRHLKSADSKVDHLEKKARQILEPEK